MKRGTPIQAFHIFETKYLPTAFWSSAVFGRTPEFRVRYAVLAPFSWFEFDDRTVKFKQEVLNPSTPV
jgi:hypothetical protein